MLNNQPSGLNDEEREWLLLGLAWVSLRHWVCGRAEGDEARAWFCAEIDRRLRPDHPLLTAELDRLEGALSRDVHAGPSGVKILAGTIAARMGEFAAL